MGGGYDAIIFSEILWYILDDLDSIIRNMKKTFSGGYILINQTFYKEGEQKYGTEYFGMECMELVSCHTQGDNAYGSHVLLKV